MKFKRAYKLSIIPNIGSPPILLDENSINFNTKSYVVSHPVIKEDNSIKPGLTIKFNVNRGFQVNNTAIIEIYNLNQVSREFLLQDKFNIPYSVEGKDKKLQYRIVTLSAGYMGSDNNKTIFDNIFIGNIMEGGPQPQRPTLSTKLLCQENGYNNNGITSLFNKSYGKGATLGDLVKDCLFQLNFNFQNLTVENLKKVFSKPLSPQTFMLIMEKLF